MADAVYPPGSRPRSSPCWPRAATTRSLTLFFREVVRMPEDQLTAFRQLPAWPARLGAAPTIARELATASACPLNRSSWRPARSRPCSSRVVTAPSSSAARPTALAEALPTSRVEVLAGQQHAAMDTAPQLFADAVLRFLAEG